MVQDTKCEKAMLDACKNGKLDSIKTLFDMSLIKNIDFVDKDKMTSLMYAVWRNYLDIVQLLVDKRASIDLQDKDNWTALKYAVSNNRIEITKLLIDKGANLDLMSNIRTSPLMSAARNGYTEIAKLLVDKGANLNLVDKQAQTALMRATSSGYTKIAEIIKNAMDKQVENSVAAVPVLSNINNDNNQDTKCEEAMLDASKNGKLDSIKTLFDLSLIKNIDFIDENKMTALNYAASKGYLDIVQFLADKGANVDLQDTEQFTALMHAAYYNKVEIAKFLVNKGAKLDFVSHSGNSALMLAITHKATEIAKFWLLKEPILVYKIKIIGAH